MATITKIEFFPFEVPLRKPFRIATMVTSAARGVFVRVELDEEFVGWGEANPLHSINGETQETVMASMPFLRHILLDQTVSPDEVHYLMNKMLPSQVAAISAVDMAVIDAFCHIDEVRLCDYFGGENNELNTDLTIPIVGPDEAKVKAQEVIYAGHSIIKVKLGGGVENDVARVSAVRDQVGSEIKIRVDANQAYALPEAHKLLNQLEKFDIQFCEQPVRRDDLEGMAFLTKRSPIPIMADESCFSLFDAHLLVEKEACHMINIKLSKAGGLYEAYDIAQFAADHNIPCMMGGMVETRLGVTAAAHLAAACPNIVYYDLDAHHEHLSSSISGVELLQNGKAVLPTGYGIGVKPIGVG
ncbi:MAG: dipeptide epimerase [Armatimonadetes bacterium]|nr:dipeptide epimerase [Armatimonadota bacterium]